MLYLLLASGAVFVAAGAVLAAQARIVDEGLPVRRGALVYLAAFAVARGGSEWADLAVMVETRAGAREIMVIVHIFLLAVSYALLLCFALALRGSGRRLSSRLVGGASLAAWGAALAVLLQGSHQADHAVPPESIEALTGYLLGLPASLCAAAGLLGLAPRLEPESWVTARLVRSAGFVFLVYGAIAAVAVLPDHLHPAWPFDPRDVFEYLGVSVEVIRAVCGAAIAILLSEAFVFQTSQRLRREETHLRDEFIALVAHELGNPAAALELASERLEADRAAGRVVDPRLCEDVQAGAQMLRRLATDLLDTSRTQARQLEVTPTLLDLRPSLDRAAEVMSARAGAGRKVVVACPADLPPVLADAVRVDQILGNLLSNAFKYSRPGSNVVIAAEPGDGEVTVRVIDEGPRLGPGEVSRIFSRHYRTGAASRGPARGHGLGLYLARGLVEAQGGRIWVDVADPLTSFCFTLPQPAEATGARLEPELTGAQSPPRLTSFGGTRRART